MAIISFMIYYYKSFLIILIFLKNMEENKKCCEGGEVENKGECCMPKMCCGMKKCHAMKFFIMIVVMIFVFCLGVQLGELKSEARGGREFRGGMMDWNYKVVKPYTDDTTVNTPVAPTATKPAVKQ
jgi:hypothetical protein